MLACDTCRTALANGDPGAVVGVALLLVAPYLVFAAVAGLVYFAYRRGAPEAGGPKA